MSTPKKKPARAPQPVPEGREEQGAPLRYSRGKGVALLSGLGIVNVLSIRLFDRMVHMTDNTLDARMRWRKVTLTRLPKG
jgi:hypothetical protein